MITDQTKIKDMSAIKTVLHEIINAIEELPLPKTRVWYFDITDGYPQLLLANYEGCKFSFNYFDFDNISRKIPAIEEYYLRNNDLTPLFKVKKIYPSREQAIADIGGYVYGVLTEVKERPTSNQDTETKPTGAA